MWQVSSLIQGFASRSQPKFPRDKPSAYRKGFPYSASAVYVTLPIGNNLLCYAFLHKVKRCCRCRSPAGSVLRPGSMGYLNFFHHAGITVRTVFPVTRKIAGPHFHTAQPKILIPFRSFVFTRSACSKWSIMLCLGNRCRHLLKAWSVTRNFRIGESPTVRDKLLRCTNPGDRTNGHEPR